MFMVYEKERRVGYLTHRSYGWQFIAWDRFPVGNVASMDEHNRPERADIISDLEGAGFTVKEEN